MAIVWETYAVATTQVSQVTHHTNTYTTPTKGRQNWFCRWENHQISPYKILMT